MPAGMAGILQTEKSRYAVGDCENCGAHSHNRHHELSLGFGGISPVLGYGVSIKGVWGCDNGFEALGPEFGANVSLSCSARHYELKD